VGEFVSEVRALGLLEETALIIASDHGEEFLDHGRMVHTQIYDESLRVPLLVLHPRGPSGRRVESLVGLADLAPTALDLLGAATPLANGDSGRPPPGGQDPGPADWCSGRSLAGLLAGEDEPLESTAYAESWGDLDRTLYWRSEDGFFQLLRFEPWFDGDGYWISRSFELDWDGSQLSFEIMSFHEPRQVQVFVDGARFRALEVGPGWRRVRLEPPGHSPVGRVRLVANGCVSPASVGESEDARCLSFKVRGTSLARLELYDLSVDRRQQVDLAGRLPEMRDGLATLLASFLSDRLAEPKTAELPPDVERRLRSLGYLR
jgi:hypothetical protein